MSRPADFFSNDPVQSGAALYLEPFGPYHAIALETGLHVNEYLESPYYSFIRGLIPFELCAETLWLSVAPCAP